jgi:thiol-disulfide isomerase/thioredoxin
VTRGRLLGLLAVLALLAGALLYGARSSDPTPQARQAEAVDLAPLREAADLPPCPPGVGPGFEQLVLPCLGEEGEVDLSQPGTGRPVLVNVWASWCGPCVREVPVLQQAALAGQGRLDVLGVLTQDTEEFGLQFAADPAVGGMDYPSVVDDQGVVMREYGTGSPPVTLFVTADGEIAWTEVGEITSREELFGLVEQHLGVRL